MYSYQGEVFNFLKPQIFNILFSYKKGLFVYTPILIMSLFSLIWLSYIRRYYLVFTWVSFFIILTYIFSSWHSWYYGCSYGMRAYIDYYTMFFIPFALLLDGVKNKIKIIIIIFSFLTIPLNIIQTYQYKTFILHWIDMDKEKFWQVYLKTEDRYKGLLWKKNYDYNNFINVKEIYIGDIKTYKNTDYSTHNINSRDIPNFEKVSIIQVLIDNEYSSQNDSKIILKIIESSSNKNYYWYDPYLIHFSENQLNKWQTGLYNFEFPPIKDNTEKFISLEVKSGNRNNNLRNVRLKFLILK